MGHLLVIGIAVADFSGRDPDGMARFFLGAPRQLTPLVIGAWTIFDVFWFFRLEFGFGFGRDCGGWSSSVASTLFDVALGKYPAWGSGDVGCLGVCSAGRTDSLYW